MSDGHESMTRAKHCPVDHGPRSLFGVQEVDLICYVSSILHVIFWKCFICSHWLIIHFSRDYYLRCLRFSENIILWSTCLEFRKLIFVICNITFLPFCGRFFHSRDESRSANRNLLKILRWKWQLVVSFVLSISSIIDKPNCGFYNRNFNNSVTMKTQ